MILRKGEKHLETDTDTQGKETIVFYTPIDNPASAELIVWLKKKHEK